MSTDFPPSNYVNKSSEIQSPPRITSGLDDENVEILHSPKNMQFSIKNLCSSLKSAQNAQNSQRRKDNNAKSLEEKIGLSSDMYKDYVDLYLRVTEWRYYIQECENDIVQLDLQVDPLDITKLITVREKYKSLLHRYLPKLKTLLRETSFKSIEELAIYIVSQGRHRRYDKMATSLSLCNVIKRIERFLAPQKFVKREEKHEPEDTKIEVQSSPLYTGTSPLSKVDDITVSVSSNYRTCDSKLKPVAGLQSNDENKVYKSVSLTVSKNQTLDSFYRTQEVAKAQWAGQSSLNEESVCSSRGDESPDIEMIYQSSVRYNMDAFPGNMIRDKNETNNFWNIDSLNRSLMEGIPILSQLSKERTLNGSAVLPMPPVWEEVSSKYYWPDPRIPPPLIPIPQVIKTELLQPLIYNADETFLETNHDHDQYSPWGSISPPAQSCRQKSYRKNNKINLQSSHSAEELMYQQEKCPFCSKLFSRRGIRRHLNYCKRKICNTQT